MADGLSAIIAVKGDKDVTLRKGVGRQWLYNMDLSNPYYHKHIDGSCLDKLIKILKTRNNHITTVFIDSFASSRGHIDVKKTYSELNNNRPRCCFSRDRQGIVKLLTIKAMRPIEFVNIGHNSKNQCVIPVIMYVNSDESYIGVNIT